MSGRPPKPSKLQTLGRSWERVISYPDLFLHGNVRSGKVRKYATFHWLLRKRVSYSYLICDWLLFPSFACPLARFPRTVGFRSDRPGVCSQKLRKPTRKAPENYFSRSRLKSSRKVRASKKSRHFTPESYGSSHARENVFGKLVGDKMAAAGALF